MTVRKNFIFDQEIATHLEFIAQKEQKTQTEIVKTLIEERYIAYSVEEKLEAFRSIVPMAAGALIHESIQSTKAQMHD
ncbi:MAG: hypothetical protein KU37_02425 [Sulfuricurvum sp. PC08-66]|nr:MAG: hypothetical protein KU37_02425 [Sulfuricurvum sp. PC08-66]